MIKRTFGDTGEKLSLLGFGTMRLPIIDNDMSKIDEDEAIAMIRHAIDHGVNYVDTAYMYHNGFSEVVTGKALKDGYREKVFLADKMPAWLAKTPEDVERIFNEQLERLGTDCIDMYLVHNLTKTIWTHAKKINVLPFLEKKREEGKIKYIGFSFHDDSDTFKQIVDEYSWDFCQIQLNYMDTNFQAGIEGLAYAAFKGLGIIVMEPLKGGKLSVNLPPTVQSVFDSYPKKISGAAWALRWVASQIGISTILSGVSTMKQLKENIDTLQDLMPGFMEIDEQEIIIRATLAFRNLVSIDCTKCQYCMPCPSNINIPDIIDRYNDLSMFNREEVTKSEFDMNVPPKGRPSACSTCKACEDHCPQALPISDIMKNACEAFESKQQ